MTKEKTIKLDVFLCDIHIVVTGEPIKYLNNNNLRLYCADMKDEDLTKDCVGFVFQKGKSDYYTMIRPDASFAAIAHESVHLIGRIFRDRGQEADYNNDEIFAYYVGWLALEITKV
ncbi:MAG: hypothetical protein LBP72_01405 [Dysgonamonadaceae bacterium]|jgi:hypothetical protein|nr:hypothetical protein [Dysgonamonadaceae bacterium]